MLEKIPLMVKDLDNKLDDLAIIIAKELQKEKDLTFKERKQLLSLIRAWSDYAKREKVDSSDLLSVRYHLLQFSKSNFINRRKEQKEAPEVRSVPIDNLSLPNGQKFKDFINKNFDGVDIFLDEHVAIYGGIARLALKLHASGTHGGEDGGLVESEIPINDIDIISDDSVTAGNYKSGIAGTKVVQDIEEYIKTYYDSVDCTMNQTLIYRGKLFFTPDALKDCAVGDLNFIEKDETLFNPDSVVLRDGKIFITSKGLYRALIYLLRQKAYRLTIYKQNLDRFIGDKSLWATPLPKILSIKDRGSKDRAIRLWFNLVSNLEATETKDPFDFLQEIIRKNPSIVNYNFKTEENNAEEIRWIINQFLRSGIRNTVPEQYPESMADNTITIDIRNPVLLGGEYDLNKFYDLINATFKNANF